MKQRRFYFDHKDAIAWRDRALKKLTGKSWQPYNSEVVDVLIIPDKKQTYYLEVRFTDGRQVSVYEFLEANKIQMSFFEDGASDKH